MELRKKKIMKDVREYYPFEHRKEQLQDREPNVVKHKWDGKKW